MMTPEEKLAARLLSKHKLWPPFDLLTLVQCYARVEETPFPLDADGISIGLGSVNKPQILINSLRPATRKKFTLAHELGHVVIPWHVGTILTEEHHSSSAELEYSEIEAEANRFASELLLPASWIISQSVSLTTIETFIRQIIDVSGVSRDAALIKIFKEIELPLVCFEYDLAGHLVKAYRPKKVTVPECPPDGAGELAFREETFHLGDKMLVCWLFEKITFAETDPRDWKEILNEMIAWCNLEEGPAKKLLMSVNATLPGGYQRYKHTHSPDEICNFIYLRFSGVKKFYQIERHPLFREYILKRVNELLKKDKIEK